ncbi:MAG: hypothetical protein ACJ8G4_15100 [Burkholderiales bacterium]
MDRAFARLCLWLGAVSALGGCAVQSQVAFDPAQNRHIRTVALVNGSIEDVLADPKRTVEGLRAGIGQIADHIARQLSGADAAAKRAS